jgi:hypothetical protein
MHPAFLHAAPYFMLPACCRAMHCAASHLLVDLLALAGDLFLQQHALLLELGLLPLLLLDLQLPTALLRHNDVP